MKVAVLMGSFSDFPLMKECISLLKDFKISFEAHVISAHRTPDEAMNFAKTAKEKGFEVIIAGAGKSAHLPGVIAALTTIPVIGVPIKSSTLDGLDSLLSIVQMPKGVPVATVAIDGAYNAGLLAIQILSLKYEELKDTLLDSKKRMAQDVKEMDLKLNEEIKNL